MAEKEMKRKMTILYGSQNGTAEELAERIWRESKRLHWSGPVLPMDSFDLSQLPKERLVVFVCSTTGQGEEPENMKTTWKFLLRKSLSSSFLSQTSIAVLGLGDSSYVKFNFVAKRLYKRLLQLGASSLLKLGLANDQHDLGIEAVAAPWIVALWKALNNKFPMDQGLTPLCPSQMLQPRYKVHLVGAAGDFDYVYLPSGSTEPAASVQQNIRTTSEEHFQDVRLLRLSAPDLVYNPGDVLQVQPCNLTENVKCFMELFGINGSALINLSAAEEAYALPLPPGWEKVFPCSLEECAGKLLDLQAPPQRYALQILAHFTASTLEKERLLEFCTPEGQQDFIEYCIRPRRTILEMLQEFPVATATLPLPYIFDVFKPLRPRSFSIASAAEACNGSVELLVAVVKYKSRLHTSRLGLCSNWMARLKPGDAVSCSVRPGSLKFPTTEDIPVIMVGPGTGCAPFRSLVQHRHAIGSKGRLVLFLGFRNKLGDFHCEAEWQSYVKQGFLTLFCAFSRDQDHKIYVQHKLLEQGPLLWKLLDQDQACFYVAGSAKNMPTSVRDAVVQLIADNKPCTKEEADYYVKQLEVSGRYQTETWS